MNDDEIRATIRQVFAEEARVPADERGSFLVEEAYRDGMLRIVSALGFMDAVPEPSAAPAEQHPTWCARGADCAPDRHNRTPEHRSAPRTVPADPGNAGGVLYGYRVTLSQVGEEPPVVEVEDGLPEAFDETARWAGLSLAQARQLAAILTDLAAEGGEVR